MFAIYAQEGPNGAEAIACEIEVIDFAPHVLNEEGEYEMIDFQDNCLMGFVSDLDDFYPEDWEENAELILDEECCEIDCDECDDPELCDECEFSCEEVCDEENCCK